MLGVWGIRVGCTASMDTNMLVSAMRKSRVWGNAQHKPRTWFRVAVEYRLSIKGTKERIMMVIWLNNNFCTEMKNGSNSGQIQELSKPRSD